MEIPYVCLWSGESSYKNNPFCIHGAQTFMQVWTWHNRYLLMVTLTHHSRRDTWLPCLLPRDAAQLFTFMFCSGGKNFTSPLQKHTWIHLQLWVAFSDFLSSLSLLENIQCSEIVSRNNSFPHNKDPVALGFLGKADLYAFSIQQIFMSLRKRAAGALAFGA